MAKLILGAQSFHRTLCAGMNLVWIDPEVQCGIWFVETKERCQKGSHGQKMTPSSTVNVRSIASSVCLLLFDVSGRSNDFFKQVANCTACR